MSKLRQLLVRANLASLREAEAYCARGWVWHDPDGHVPLGARIARDEESGGVLVAVAGGDGVIGLDKRAVHDQHSRLGGVVLHKPYSFLSHHAAGSRSRDAKTILTANNASSNRAAGGGRAGGGQGHTTWPSVCAWAGVDPANTPDLHVTGRLDADSTGLLVFTRSGLLGRHLVASGERGLSDEVLDHGVGGEGGGAPFEKEYLVRVTVKNGHDRPPPRQRDLDAIVASLGGGVLELDGQRVQPAVVRWLHPGVLQFVMSEGRHRQIRRMCELVRRALCMRERERELRVSLFYTLQIILFFSHATSTQYN